MSVKSDYYRIGASEVHNSLNLVFLDGPDELHHRNPEPIITSKSVILQSQGGVWITDPEKSKIVDYNTVLNVKNFADFLVVSSRLADILQDLAPNDIQRIPAIVDGIYGQFEAIHIISHVDCLDYGDSIITSYWPQAPLSPKGVILLVVDKHKVNGPQIFRVTHSELDVVVSCALYQSLCRENLSGYYFEPAAVSTNELMADESAREYFGPRLMMKRAPSPKGIVSLTEPDTGVS